MARRVIVACDICGTEPATSQQFGFGESNYEIDVCLEHGTALQDALQPYIDKGSEVVPDPVPGIRTQRRGSRSTTKADPDQTKAVREWAQANKIMHNGKPLGNRGRIPQEIVDQYNSMSH